MENNTSSVVAASDSVSAYELCLVDSIGHVLLVSSPSSTEFPELHLIFGCGTLYMLSPDAEESLVDDDWDRR